MFVSMCEEMVVYCLLQLYIEIRCEEIESWRIKIVQRKSMTVFYFHGNIKEDECQSYDFKNSFCINFVRNDKW